MSKRRLQKFERYDCSSSDSDEERHLPSLKKERHVVEAFGPDLPPHLKTPDSLQEEFGPVLPPHLSGSKTEKHRPRSNEKKRSKTESISFGPALPPHLQETFGPSLPPHIVSKTKTEEPCSIGPVLPPHLLQSVEKIESNVEELDSFGPALPPELQKTFGPSLPPRVASKTQKPCSIGPVLPPHLLQAEEKYESSEEDVESFGPVLPSHLHDWKPSTSSKKKPTEKLLGPELPPGFVPLDSSSSEEEEEEDTSYGPDPRLMSSGDAGNYNDVDERMARARRKMLEKANKKLERETWMLDLPPERAANLGLGPRQFRAKPAPEMGDRSIWTDTPADKAKKKDLPPKIDDKDLIRKSLIAARDEEMEKMAKKAESKLKRKESLLDSHAKKLKKDAKDGTNKNDETEGERKRFNREKDMQVNRFDEAQKKAIFKKAQLLNDRFSQGESKYL